MGGSNDTLIQRVATDVLAEHRETLNRISEFERFVLVLGPGEVGRLVPTDGETSRSVRRKIKGAAERLNILVAVRTVEGAVYFRSGDSNPSDRPSVLHQRATR